MSKCPTCSNPLTYVQQYDQWFCHTCRAYKQPVAEQAQPTYQQPSQAYQPPPGYQPPTQQQSPQQQSPPQYRQAQPTYQQQPQAYQPPPQPPAPQQSVPLHHQQPPPSVQPNYPQGMGGELESRIENSPSFSTLTFSLKPGQSVVTEKGAMMHKSPNIDIQTGGRSGGIMKGLATSVLGGESFFVNTYTATRGPGDLALVGPTMGDIRAIDVSRQPMILQSGAFLASNPEVALDTKWQGLKGFLAERDFVMLRASGQGKVWVTSFGAIIERELKPGETLSVDTGHLVAFPDNMQYSVHRVGGWKSTILSGEGLVTELVGPGKILMQTRTMGAFAAMLLPYLPDRK